MCHIVPLWAEKLHKENIIARQASERGGTLYCNSMGNGLQWLEMRCFIQKQNYSLKAFCNQSDGIICLSFFPHFP